MEWYCLAWCRCFLLLLILHHFRYVSLLTFIDAHRCHSVNVVSQEYLMQHNNWKCIRTCNAMAHSYDALFIPNLVGIQGKAFLLLENEVMTLSAGLLLLRAYAITDHKRSVLVVLGILGTCTIVPELVCTHAHVCDWRVRQTPVTGSHSLKQLWPYQYANPHHYNVSPTYLYSSELCSMIH